MKIHLKLVKDLENKHLKDIVGILNNDKKLIEQLGNSKEPLSCPEFVIHTKKWSKENKAQVFAIIMSREAMGLISLSHINRKTQAARIGYWIASKYWNKGYAFKAFEQILNLAKKDNIRIVSCSIPKENRVSMAIWKKFNAKIEQKGDTIVPQIYL